MKNLKVIAFVLMTLYSSTETYFAGNRQKFCGLMEDYLSHQVFQELFKMEIDNLKLYGYGIKIYPFHD
jgi:putative hydrolase of the HAD superfamily